MKSLTGIFVCILTVLLIAFALADIPIDEAHFPDAVFRDRLSKRYDKSKDGILNDSEIPTYILVEGESVPSSKKGSICSLEGLALFPEIDSLVCGWNMLESVDLSGNTALGSIQLQVNLLTNLDVSKCASLTYLECWENQLTSLDVSSNPLLTELGCGDNQLPELNLCSNPALIKLNCYNNLLTALDLSNNTALDWLNCYGNQLTELDISHNASLTNLYCHENQLMSLDTRHNPSLQYLTCNDNRLTSLDLSVNLALSQLSCSDNQLSVLDISGNTELVSIKCVNNQLTSLTLGTKPNLGDLWCSGNYLTELDISQCPNLVELVQNYEPEIMDDCVYYHMHRAPLYELKVDPGIKLIIDASGTTVTVPGTLQRSESSEKPIIYNADLTAYEDSNNLFCLSANIKASGATEFKLFIPRGDDELRPYYWFSSPVYPNEQNEESEIHWNNREEIQWIMHKVEFRSKWGTFDVFIVPISDGIEGDPYYTSYTYNGEKRRAYYSLLKKHIDETNLLLVPEIDQAVLSRLIEEFKLPLTDAYEMTQKAKFANKTYRNLWVYSLYDISYGETTMPTQEKKTSYSKYGNALWLDNKNVNRFHEFGHGIDGNIILPEKGILDVVYYTESDNRKEKLFQYIKKDVRNILDSMITSQIDLVGSREQLLDMMTEEQYVASGDKDTRLRLIGAPILTNLSIVGFFQGLSFVDFADVGSDLLSSNNLLFADMIDAVTNGLLSDIWFRQSHSAMDPYYWFDIDGVKTYNENTEAWAEYFSSQFTNKALINKELFPYTTRYLDELAVEMENIYRDRINCLGGD